jgi:hypothetical protein
LQSAGLLEAGVCQVESPAVTRKENSIRALDVRLLPNPVFRDESRLPEKLKKR